MFADDCIIFCRANKKTTTEIKYILGHYCQVLCQSINYHKSIIQFSIDIEKSIKSEISIYTSNSNRGIYRLLPQLVYY